MPRDDEPARFTRPPSGVHADAAPQLRAMPLRVFLAIQAGALVAVAAAGGAAFLRFGA